MAKRGSLTRELTLAAKVSRRRKSESEQAYFNRIMLEVGGLSDDVRENLSHEAQAWYGSEWWMTHGVLPENSANLR
jgi:hypothetical protein